MTADFTMRKDKKIIGYTCGQFFFSQMAKMLSQLLLIQYQHLSLARHHVDKNIFKGRNYRGYDIQMWAINV